MKTTIKMQFDPEIAKNIGVEEAIMYSNIESWCAYYKANDKHFYDEHYWVYNSKKAFSELFTFWTEDQIKRILNNLIKKRYIETNNYNKHKYDRTLWYRCISSSHWEKPSEPPNASGETTQGEPPNASGETTQGEPPNASGETTQGDLPNALGETTRPIPALSLSSIITKGNKAKESKDISCKKSKNRKKRKKATFRATHGRATPARSSSSSKSNLNQNHPSASLVNLLDEDLKEEKEKKKQSKQIVEIFDIFIKTNKAIKFGNKTERDSITNLIKELGFEETKKMAKYAISIREEEFSPKITTPYEFWQKLTKLNLYYKKNNETGRYLSKMTVEERAKLSDDDREFESERQYRAFATSEPKYTREKYEKDKIRRAKEKEEIISLN